MSRSRSEKRGEYGLAHSAFGPIRHFANKTLRLAYPCNLKHWLSLRNCVTPFLWVPHIGISSWLAVNHLQTPLN
jgi:hypothetical protein